MDFNGFKRNLICKVQLFLGSEYEVVEQEVTKNNGVRLHGIMAKKAGQNTFPTVYVDEHYDEHMSKDEIEYLAMNLSKTLIRAELPENISLDSFLNYETARDRLYLKLVNADRNRDLLLDVPHRRFHNLAVVYYYAMEDSCFDRKASILIRNSHMEQWEVEEKTLHEDALKSAPLLNPGTFVPMRDLLRELYGKDVIHEDFPLYVLTNHDRYNGASAILYPGMTERIAQTVGGSYYILPSSVHELIVVPDDGNTDKKTLLSMVTEINLVEVTEEELLADAVYYFSPERGETEWIC